MRRCSWEASSGLLSVSAQQIRTRMRAILQTHTARNMRLLSEFSELARRSQERGVDFMPVKGVHLCTSLYENIGERTDLGHRPAGAAGTDARGAARWSRRSGYRASRPFDLDLEVRNYHHVPPFVKRDAPPLEIHWTLLNPRFQNGLNWQELWGRSVVDGVGGGGGARAVARGSAGVPVRARGVPAHLHRCAAVAVRHQAARQKRAGDLDWGAITARARTWGLGNSVYLSLRLTDELLGCPVPDAAWPVLRPAEFSEGLLEAARRRVLEHSDRSPVVSAVWSRRSLLQRLRGLWGRLMVPRSVLAGRYHLPPNSWTVNLYYFVRAWDLLRVHGRDLLDLLLGRRSKRELALRESELIAYLNWWQ